MIQTGKRNLEDFIKVYDDIFSQKECKELIDAFKKGEQEFIAEDKRPQFYQVTLDEMKSREIVAKLTDSINQYADDIPVLDYMFPAKYSYEMVRVQRYRHDHDDQFADHVDVVNHESAKRFLSFILHLNDVEEGGETYFIGIDKSIVPKRGRLLIFPPMWMFPHCGNETISNTKYILSTYLHYV